ncbi:organelle RRM domain-containing protein 6, chloroplastic-like isoform X1 [Rhododendron vialii]|uniref:organelle RRM domain-containing protein 6, chloroplastic-like isoform X1 n=1 Tax=Rhododendron vialii TaxID=182163 RepID=UPI00265F1669|nr:organelle RRM domain-containing protein 6, chloroplastic-like isoform X1 [Rhododendron vialii]
MNSTGVWFGCSSTPQPIFGKLVQNRTKPKFLKLHASLVNFPLASKIMVRNLSYSTTESCLRDEFSTYGQVAEVKLVVDEDSKRSKGYAFIQYTSQDDAILALESMDHKYLDGRLVFVELAKPGRNAFRGYPKTCGPSPQEKIPVLSKRKKKERISVPKQEEAIGPWQG